MKNTTDATRARLAGDVVRAALRNDLIVLERAAFRLRAFDAGEPGDYDSPLPSTPTGAVLSGYAAAQLAEAAARIRAGLSPSL